jgi:hypothetical protein
LIFGSFIFIVFCQGFFSRPFLLFSLFFLSVLLSFLLLSNWFLFLSSFIFPLIFRHCFIPISLTHVVLSLAYPNLLGTKRLGCCCCCCCYLLWVFSCLWYWRRSAIQNVGFHPLPCGFIWLFLSVFFFHFLLLTFPALASLSFFSFLLPLSLLS